jgi:Ala-tRNA(Pro) deacylase
MNVQNFLTQQNVPFDVLEHESAYDALRVAQALHVPGIEVAKTVLLRANHDDNFIVAVLPATCSIDLDQVSDALGGSMIELATESEVGEHCPDCELGALPPFGSQYDMQTVVDESLAVDEEIVFEGNTHQEAIRMKYQDFLQVERPMVLSFARSRD